MSLLSPLLEPHGSFFLHHVEQCLWHRETAEHMVVSLSLLYSVYASLMEILMLPAVFPHLFCLFQQDGRNANTIRCALGLLWLQCTMLMVPLG